MKKLKWQMRQLRKIEIELKRHPDEQLSLTDPDARSMAHQWPRHRHRRTT